MYLQTPRRYSRGRRGQSIFPWRKLFLLTLTVMLAVGGYLIYENRERLAPQVEDLVGGIVGEAEQRVNEITAPTPVPTQDPTEDKDRADELWARGSIQEATNLYQRIADAAPNDLSVHYRIALGFINQGRYEQGLEAAENAITARPFAPDGWSIRSMALNRMGRNREALASAMRAVELVPESLVEEQPAMAASRARALAYMAEAYLNLSQIDRAQSTVRTALEVYPDSFEAHQVRGRVNQEGVYDFQTALNDYREALTIAPNMVYVAIWAARMERTFENYEEALGIYREIIEKNPGNTPVLFELGDFYFRVEGNYGEASSYFSRCIDADPNNAQCYYMLGRAQMSMQEVSQALVNFETALNLNPEGQGGYYHYWMARANISLGQCAQAGSFLQTGYQLAQDRQDDSLADAFELSFDECRVPVAPPVPGDEGEDAESEEGAADTDEGDSADV